MPADIGNKPGLERVDERTQVEVELAAGTISALNGTCDPDVGAPRASAGFGQRPLIPRELLGGLNDQGEAAVKHAIDAAIEHPDEFVEFAERALREKDRADDEGGSTIEQADRN